MSDHNKRMNPGLVTEFLVMSVSDALVSGDQARSAAAVRILRKHLRPDTALYREFRLINALVRTPTVTETTAALILREARAAAQSSADRAELDRQKAAMLRDIVRTVRDPLLFDRPVAEYRAYATAQTLLNEWRRMPSGRVDIGRLAQFEDAMVRHLVKERTENPSPFLNEEPTSTNRAVLRLMERRIREKWGGRLTEEQSSLVRAFGLGDRRALADGMERIRSRVVAASKQAGVGIDPSKLTEAVSRISVEDITESATLDEAVVSRFMLYSSLADELESRDAQPPAPHAADGRVQ